MLEKAKNWIEKSIKHLDIEFRKLQLGRANPAQVEDIMVETYWNFQPIKNSASVSLLDNQTLSIKPWDKQSLHTIAKAITNAWIWLNPQTMADSIIIKIPSLTEDRRKEVVKIAKKLSEEAKVAIRTARLDSLKDIKRAEESKEISEDILKNYEIDLQKLVDDANKKVDEMCKNKESDIMKI